MPMTWFSREAQSSEISDRSCERLLLAPDSRKSPEVASSLREIGTTFVTKVSLRQPIGGNPMKEGVLVFPTEKRRRLHGMIGSYLSEQTDWPEKVSGFVAEFIYYHKNVKVPTVDRKTFRLCRENSREWSVSSSPLAVVVSDSSLAVLSSYTNLATITTHPAVC